MFGDYHYHYPSLLDLWRWQGVCRHCVNAVLRSSPMQRNFLSILLLQTPPYPSFLSSLASWFLQINRFYQNNLWAQAGWFYKAKLYKGILLSCRSWAMVGNGMASSFFPLFRNLISSAVPIWAVISKFGFERQREMVLNCRHRHQTWVGPDSAQKHQE